MLSIIQLVSHAHVEVEKNLIASIGRGILALVGIEKMDTQQDAEKLFHKIVNYRIFPDEEGKMNLSLLDVGGGLLLVPQFTLVAETSKGTRPGFSTAMPPAEGRQIFEYLVHFARQQDLKIEQGSFGADMQVSLCNDGPVTFLLKV